MTPGTVYHGDRIGKIAFPMGGMGAGMVCLEGSGALSHLSIRHRPDVHNDPFFFAALSLDHKKERIARVLEGPVPDWKIMGPAGSGTGHHGKTYGLPRFASAEFEARFPFGTVRLRDSRIPVEVDLTGWSPFIPGDADASSLPVAGLEYTFTNKTKKRIRAVFSFNGLNPFSSANLNTGKIETGIAPLKRGFAFYKGRKVQGPSFEGALAVATDDPQAKTNLSWFRGNWFDPVSTAWRDVARGACYSKRLPINGVSPGATLFIPLDLAPGGKRTIKLLLGWYWQKGGLKWPHDKGEGLACCGDEERDPAKAYRPWYAGRFKGIFPVMDFWEKRYAPLRTRTLAFTDCLFDSTIPAPLLDAVSANLSILKSPTVLRQPDGRLWGWEGCEETQGCCPGSCSHVWNYAQSIPHLFPDLERGMRETEFFTAQQKDGYQAFRVALPIRPRKTDFHSAADGQLGSILKAHRDWRVSGDKEWLKRLWPRILSCMDYCIKTWDPDRRGLLFEPHHNTYDIEFWGPEAMCGSVYLAALSALCRMGSALRQPVEPYRQLLDKGIKVLEGELFNGEYFIQRVLWKGLRAKSPLEDLSLHTSYSPEAMVLLRKEGPKYQYGRGCLSDGVIGAWMGEVCGLGGLFDSAKVRSHLRSVVRNNWKRNLSRHANPQRPGYALGREGGLLLCTWPKGGRPTLPFVYCDEVWTGIEYQVASHLIMMGEVKAGVDIVKVCRRRYNGRVRNPFDEYECGHWYARAMASYALLQAISGARYDAVEKTLYLNPSLKGDYKCFLSTATGFGLVGVRKGKPFLKMRQGTLDLKKIVYQGRPSQGSP